MGIAEIDRDDTNYGGTTAGHGANNANCVNYEEGTTMGDGGASKTTESGEYSSGADGSGDYSFSESFPIVIDSDRFQRALELSAVKVAINELSHRFAGRKVMLGVDQLDMIKGIPQKLLAFEKFLEENPVWRDKVVLLQIVVPTQTDVPECERRTEAQRGLDSTHPLASTGIASIRTRRFQCIDNYTDIGERTVQPYPKLKSSGSQA
ncbi:Alpha,alpha-trehalose-phosphate synthase [UDP-forming] 1 [Platanthera guangdongensis]|uniref:Alpha,alpha-trehalose-phosphate synthase [UDP-forming] 1 n=1 Tax=Platanthera guangdongensis TaxID=2320717 RepID=A0ABR2N2J8_9ASPA